MAQIVSWEWDFGDGETSTLQSPYHIYRNPGVYSVRLKVTLSDGVTKTLEKQEYVSVHGAAGTMFDLANSENSLCIVYSVSSDSSGCWTIFSGHWPSPESPAAVMDMFLGDDVHKVVWDYNTGLPFIINPRPGVVGSGIEVPYRDMVGHPDYPDGFPIESRLVGPAVIGSLEKYRISHEESYFTIRPLTSYLNPETVIDAFLVKDGSSYSETQSLSVNPRNEVVFTNTDLADSIAVGLRVSESGYRINTMETTIKQVQKLRYATASLAGEIRFDSSFSDPYIWLTRGWYKKNRSTGEVIPSMANAAEAVGPDGISGSAAEVSMPLVVSIVSASAVVVWTTVTPVFDKTPTSVIKTATEGSWSCYYITGIPTDFCSLTIPSGRVYDLRVFDVSISEPGDTPQETADRWITSYANDVVENRGDKYIPAGVGLI